MATPDERPLNPLQSLHGADGVIDMRQYLNAIISQFMRVPSISAAKESQSEFSMRSSRDVFLYFIRSSRTNLADKNNFPEVVISNSKHINTKNSQ